MNAVCVFHILYYFSRLCLNFRQFWKYKQTSVFFFIFASEQHIFSSAFYTKIESCYLIVIVLSCQVGLFQFHYSPFTDTSRLNARSKQEIVFCSRTRGGNVHGAFLMENTDGGSPIIRDNPRSMFQPANYHHLRNIDAFCILKFSVWRILHLK